MMIENNTPKYPPIRRERLSTIETMVVRDGSVRVSELADVLGVSTETVRRDLAALDRAGVLERAHGGAIRRPQTVEERTHVARSRLQFHEKKLIATIAAGLISDGQVIAVDSSTTTLAMARMLRGRPITIITNSVLFASALAGDDATTVIVTGGVLNHDYMSLVGPIAEGCARSYFPDVAFISTPALSRNGVTDVSPLQVAVKQQLVSGAQRVCVLADHTKFDRTALELILDWTDVDTLITDQPPEVGFSSFLRAHDVEILCS